MLVTLAIHLLVKPYPEETMYHADPDACAGNALTCTVHQSPWAHRYGQPSVACEHVRLRGKAHQHDTKGRRTPIGTTAAEALHCDCARDDQGDSPTTGSLW